MSSRLRWFEDSDWSYLKITGADRNDFFRRLTTNHLPKVGESLVHSFFLSVNAKVIAELWLGAEDESLSVFLPAAQLAAAKENIDRFHFGEKMQIVEPQGKLYVLFDADAAELERLAPLSAYAAQPDPRYGQRSLWLFVEDAACAEFVTIATEIGEQADPEEIVRRRVATGRPQCGLDYTEETLFLEMAQQGDFSETKGCYPGQEIVARVLHRGRLHRHLRGFLSSVTIPSGWSALHDGKEVARVTTSVSTADGGSCGLLYVRREHGAEGTELSGVFGDGPSLKLVVTARPLELLTGEPE